jgi:hypothetical protein
MSAQDTTFEVQTRSEDGELRYWSSLEEAFQHSKQNTSVWKISFPVGSGERCRLVRYNKAWIYENIKQGMLAKP